MIRQLNIKMKPKISIPNWINLGIKIKAETKNKIAQEKTEYVGGESKITQEDEKEYLKWKQEMKKKVQNVKLN